MELKQQLKMSQQLVMTPQLQQAIKLLQMSRMELTELVHAELLENPMLEDSSEGRDSKEVHLGEPNNGAGEETTNGAVATKDFDWDRYVENQIVEGGMPRSAYQAPAELPQLENNTSEQEGLSSHLLWQLQMGDFVADEREFGELVIGNLDDRGYLTIENIPAEQVVPQLAAELGLNPEDAEEVLKMMQRFDPVGVAARSLEECLIVQAEHYEFDPLVMQVIRSHLGDLERRSYDTIAKALGCAVDEVFDIAQVISELEPRPARRFETSEANYIVPDVYVNRVNEEYFVSANDDGLPKLRISNVYRAAMTDSSEARSYIQDKLKSAQWLIRSIDQRRKTIVRVTECIVAMQREFFDKGIDFLKPMVLRDVADQLELHESTVSRVTSNKYVHTPRGIFELKYFFSRAIRRTEQDDIASASVKEAIRTMVAAEDTNNPLSDQQIVEQLAQTGIQIARRTVAKYREAMGIVSSARRKKYF